MTMKIPLKKYILFVVFCLLLPVAAWAATYTVTQDGSGADYSISEFNALSGDKSGDTFYFSGTITSQIKPQIYGSASGYVTLDGYEAGDCDPINSGHCGAELTENCDPATTCTDSNTPMIDVVAKDYIIIQDFYVHNANAGIFVRGDGGSSATADYDIIRRNYVEYIRNQGLWIGQSAPSYSSTTYCTMGGGPGQGNLVHDAGWAADYSRDLWDVEARGYDIVISYNKFYNDIPSPYPPGYPGNIIESGDTSRILIEHNEIYGAGFEAGISLKEHGVIDAIVRFNKIHDNAPTYDQGYGIDVSDDSNSGNRTRNVYIYGNEIYNNRWGVNVQHGAYNVHVFSNVIYNNNWFGFCIMNSGLGGVDGQSYATVVNNVFAENGDTSVYRERTGVRIHACISPGCIVKNNLFYDNRKSATSRFEQVWVNSGDPATYTTLEHNTYWRTDSNAPTIRWGGDAGTSYTVSGIQAQGHEDDSPAGKEADPKFTAPASDDYTLDGTTVNDGANLTQNFSMTIQGTTYTFGYSDCLDPDNTDWSTTIPTVATINQNDYGTGWERGAYVYTGGSAPTQPRKLYINSTGHPYFYNGHPIVK